MACPVCGTELTLAQLFAHEDTQRTFARLAAVSLPVGARVTQYITLFAPAKTRLTLPKQMRLILQLLPDLERRAIAHRGRDWAAPLEAWAQAIDQMMAARDANRLELPMKGHTYLYAILAGQADKHEAKAEAQRETDRRTAPEPGMTKGTVVVRGQTMSIGQGLDQVFGGRDPALAKIDADRSAAVPMPESVRARIDELRGKGGTT